MNPRISRRSILGAPLVLGGCLTAGPYFGRTEPPASQRLVYANGEEPSTLDPALLVGSRVNNVVAALLDSLTALHPFTSEPMAALATHFEVDRRGSRYTFFLRGHPSPRGTRLPNTDDLPAGFARGRRAPPDGIPASWSDGRIITAQDFVFAWKRLADPRTAASLAFYLNPLVNAEQIAKGKKPVETLGVFAPDEFTFEFELTSQSSAFLKLLWQPFLAAVPRHAVGPGWTTPGRYPSSGPFVLREWRPYDRIVLAKNRHYWEADSVQLENIILLPIADGTTVLNLYRSGAANAVGRGLVPPTFVPALATKKDFNPSRAYASTWYSMDVNQPPLDRLPVRYALSMATDRRAIADFLGHGHRPATGVVPPMPGYPARGNLVIPINGHTLDILQFNPGAARDLLNREQLGSVSLTLTVPLIPGSIDVAPIVQAQWRQNLGIEVTLRSQEETAWEQSLIQHKYQHVILDDWTAFYEDPYDFLSQFGPAHYAATTWADAAFDSSLDAANRTADEVKRMHALFACEDRLLRSMPLIPITFDGWASLEMPYVSGLRTNPFGCPRFKYVSIDTQWKPQRS